tara:strand:- start:16 stop:720 length:705 start_codon:yes stop_codon:yes gene_type:complete
MGFNFLAAGIEEIMEPSDADSLASLIRANVPGDPPISRPGFEFCMRDEIGWSWWSELQQYAAQRLGEDRVQALLAVDAWTGAYLDVDRDRLLLWPDGEPDADASESQPTIEALGHQPVSFISRILRFFGIGRSSDAEPDPEIRGMLDAMVSSFGAREGESGAFQIASLPRLIGELNEILAHEGIGANEESIRRALAEYENENRFDDDPHIQCLCHAWLTSQVAMENACPMWLLK